MASTLLGGGAAMVIAEQIRAARALLSWSQEKLAKAAGVSTPTIKRIEASTGHIRSNYSTMLAVIAALEDVGIEFISEGGVGVKISSNSTANPPPA